MTKRVKGFASENEVQRWAAEREKGKETATTAMAAPRGRPRSTFKGRRYHETLTESSLRAEGLGWRRNKGVPVMMGKEETMATTRATEALCS
ncbi:hypothetical protein E2562_013358 [Oryza meyeriana var. granulata]|uniref:Uncharacterized protein n=1 Tax=Oryza meyeriana var. granulata TaxID=110450 RepID=A0A6G1CHP8_9ORYZ|nr:hypothetical protein E2562_013358 [Oryza meyeriana var. granulata]